MQFLHVPGKKNVVDYLNCTPVAEKLPEEDLSSHHLTLEVQHFCNTEDCCNLVRLIVNCPHCRNVHIDEAKYATFNHAVHIC